MLFRSYAAAGYTAELSAVIAQSFIGLASFGSLVLAAVIAQWRTTLGDLTRARDELEVRVAARTQALADSEGQLRENEERFRLARGAARIIVVDWEIATDTLMFSDSPEWLRGPLPEGGRYPYFKLQVHPDDLAAARQTPPDLGKTEAWFILDAAPGAKIFAGLKPGVTQIGRAHV